MVINVQPWATPTATTASVMRLLGCYSLPSSPQRAHGPTHARRAAHSSTVVEPRDMPDADLSVIAGAPLRMHIDDSLVRPAVRRAPASPVFGDASPHPPCDATDALLHDLSLAELSLAHRSADASLLFERAYYRASSALPTVPARVRAVLDAIRSRCDAAREAMESDRSVYLEDATTTVAEEVDPPPGRA